jgi:hypothetical protein
MTGEEFRQKIAEIEAKANMAYGAYINRRTGNGGRYWALGSVIAELGSARQRETIDQWMATEIEAVETEFYSGMDV